ncbi:Protein canopy homolog 4 [Strongyloides ratti]|uniref:Protein canopy homolog 4 n=1 Tax=Strongyloides ratti TaxID=34506 RepID=A0A090LPL7_STRRB|nr:Protein canopy homolog 4 [Strongyloides ratti]CEF69490.1 Protein canopy homolog 4 [Strongyloides ratti]
MFKKKKENIKMLHIQQLLLILTLILSINSESLPSKCESCAIIAREFKDELFKIKNLPKTISRNKAEELFLELNEIVCKNMLSYRLDPTRDSGIDRFFKGTPEALKQLKELRDKGVKITMDVPEDLWDKPGIESSLLKQHCESLLEEYEDIIVETIINKTSFEIFVCTIEMKCPRFYKKEL